MIYLLIPTETACRDLSASLWRLSTPITHGYADANTQYAVGWVKHPSRDEWALCIPEDFGFRRHPFVITMLTSPTDEWGSQALMAQNFMPIAANGAASLQALGAYVIANDVVMPVEVLQFINTSLIRTHAQMDADGWFPPRLTP